MFHEIGTREGNPIYEFIEPQADGEEFYGGHAYTEAHRKLYGLLAGQYYIYEGEGEDKARTLNFLDENFNIIATPSGFGLVANSGSWLEYFASFDYVPASFSEPTTYYIRVAPVAIRTDGGAETPITNRAMYGKSYLKQFSVLRFIHTVSAQRF